MYYEIIAPERSLPKVARMKAAASESMDKLLPTTFWECSTLCGARVSSRWLAKDLSSEISGSIHSAAMNGHNPPGMLLRLPAFPTTPLPRRFFMFTTRTMLVRIRLSRS